MWQRLVKLSERDASCGAFTVSPGIAAHTPSRSWEAVYPRTSIHLEQRTVLISPCFTMSKPITREVIVQSSDRTPIWADATGSPTNPALVLIHGLAGTALGFDKQVADERLIEKVFVVRYEMRGHGRSGMPLELADYASKQHAEDFKAVCEAFGVIKPVLFGWSIGAAIAVDIAEYLGPEYLSGVIYCGGPTLSLSLCTVTIPSSWMPFMSYVTSSDGNVAARFASRFVESCIFDHERLLPWPIKLQWMAGFGIQPPVVRQLSTGREQQEGRWKREAHGWPVMLIHGTEDEHCIPEVVIAQAKEIYDNVEVHLLERVGHSPHFERPMEVNALIVAFMEKLRVP
ncbi:alpha/beta-hydrolase [Laetiporus sulphureus 93-53]|uniref:Alpha/beta-hydrolase n=1 Tax=Laetiporus sulphureus 93-53 TaxID=1314785 RepID=A0A165G9F0_9APHY|nr:alpha/beta-hydrolase [Laetiporus sulphureus 93-53]KZT10020.1 alpha/beta-hydrolase [Laetiporus sulphureus 93-53]